MSWPFYAWDGGSQPTDVVWDQMASHWAETGQLDRATIAAWDADGRSEAGFYALGTRASYGAEWSDQVADPASSWWSAPGASWSAVTADDSWATGYRAGLAGAWL